MTTVPGGNVRIAEAIYLHFALLTPERRSKREVVTVIDHASECLRRASRPDPERDPLDDRLNLRGGLKRIMSEYSSQVIDGDAG